MVIQRWQTVLLFIAVICMGIFSVAPLACMSTQMGETASFMAYQEWGYFLLNIIITLLLLISIFLFKQLNTQSTLVLVSMFLMIISVICGLWIYYDLVGQNPIEEVKLSFSGLLLIGAFVFSLLSLICIRKDRKLLQSYDRLR